MESKRRRVISNFTFDLFSSDKESKSDSDLGEEFGTSSSSSEDEEHFSHTTDATDTGLNLDDSFLAEMENMEVWEEVAPIRSSAHTFYRGDNAKGECSQMFNNCFNRSDITPYSVFSVMCTDEFLEEIVMESNNYAMQCESSFTMSLVDLKKYLGLTIIMSQVKKQSVTDYWIQFGPLATPVFSKTMPRNKFSMINRFLHFSNNDTADNNDKLRKINPVIENANSKFKENYNPSQRISIDESLMKYKGRLSFKQFNPTKRARFGVKFYKLCDSENGYVIKFKIYIGDDKKHCDIPASAQVVLDFLGDYKNNGYTIFIDNWYSSICLFRTLYANGFNAVGTLRANRKGIPVEIKYKKLKKGETSAIFCQNLMILKWKDKKDVLMLSTFHGHEMTTSSRRAVVKPKCVEDYNKGMGGVDIHDQRLAIAPIMRKYAKAYKKIFFYIFDMMLQNSYILYKKKVPEYEKSYRKYCLEISECLIDEPYEEQCRSDLHIPVRIISATGKRACRRCIHCKNRGESGATTSYKCKKCDVALHAYCFEDFHIV